MYYITSDLHFCHNNIVKYQPNRGATSVREMNEKIIREWNALVTEEDTIYHLGDFCFKGGEFAPAILDNLKGKKIFILGNHDKENTLKPYGKTHQYLEIRHGSFDICLFHFPIVHWHRQEYGTIHFYGHTHGSFNNHGRSMDVGYDKHNRILSLDEAVNMVKDREVIKRDYGIKEV